MSLSIDKHDEVMAASFNGLTNFSEKEKSLAELRKKHNMQNVILTVHRYILCFYDLHPIEKRENEAGEDAAKAVFGGDGFSLPPARKIENYSNEMRTNEPALVGLCRNRNPHIVLQQLSIRMLQVGNHG